MSLRILLPVIILLVSGLVSATTINVSAEKDEFLSGEVIRLRLEIRPSEPVGGQFVVYKKEDSKYTLARMLYSRPSPGQCYTCAGGFPVSEDLSRNFSFRLREEGEYYAEANFGDARNGVGFTVVGEFTSTSTSTTTVTSTTSTTTSTSSTSSIPVLPTVEKEPWIPLGILLLALLLALLIIKTHIHS